MESCGKPVGSPPWWLSRDQWSPCPCWLVKGHNGPCSCSHIDVARTAREDGA